MLRKLKRNVARVNMLKQGCTRINKGKPSYFAQHWREYI